MAIPLWIMAASQIGSAVDQAGAERGRARYLEAMGEVNASLAEYEAAEAIRQGDSAAKAFQRRYSKLRGRQRVSLAAQGIDIDFGSASEIQRETMELSAEDVEEIKMNAWRQAFGLKQEAIRHRRQGRFDRLGGEEAARQTLAGGILGGTAKGIDAYRYGKGKGKR